MRHVKSNLNILKPNKNINAKLKPSKSNNNFKKCPTSLQLIENNLDMKTINNNNLLNFFEKSCKNSAFNSIVFNSNNKPSNTPNQKYPFNRKNKANKSNYSNSSNTIFNNNNNSSNTNRGISIRLNFKNKIINNNYAKKNNKVNSKTKNNNFKNLNINNNNNYKYDFNINERIKEKDKQITLLQKDLLQSQKLLNQLQEEKQKEISSTYNTIKHVDSYINLNNNSVNSNHSGMSKYSSLSDFLSSNTEKNLRILKTVYAKRNVVSTKSNSKNKIYGNKNKSKNINKSKKKNNLNLYINTSSLAKFHFFNNNLLHTNKNCKTRNNIYKNYNIGNFNSGPNSNTNKKSKNLSQTKLMRLFSYSPNKLLTNYLYHYESNSKNSKNTLKKNNNNLNIIYNLNSNSPSSAQNRSNNKMIQNIINNSYKSKDLSYIINKGEDLKKRTRNLLNKYIILSYQIKDSNSKK